MLSENVRSSVVSDYLGPHGLQLARFPCPWDSPGKNTGVGCHFLLHNINFSSIQFSGIHCICDIVQPQHLSSFFKFQDIFIKPSENLVPIKQLLPIPHALRPLKTTALLSFYADEPTLDATHKWNHVTHKRSRLASFTGYTLKFHPHCNMYQYFIPFSGQIVFHCKGVPQFVYPVNSGGTLGSFGHLGYCE